MVAIGSPRWFSGKEFPADAGDAGDASLIPGSGRSPGGGHDNPHSSILAWRIPWTEEPKWATVPWITKSQTQLSD